MTRTTLFGIETLMSRRFDVNMDIYATWDEIFLSCRRVTNLDPDYTGPSYVNSRASAMIDDHPASSPNPRNESWD